MEKLFAAIDAEAPVAKKASFNFIGRVVEFMSSFSPRTLAYAGTAAAIVLMVQAAVLTTVVVRNQDTPASHTLASVPTLANQRAVVRFTANATLGDVTRFLDVNQAVRGARSEPRRYVRDPARHLADAGRRSSPARSSACGPRPVSSRSSRQRTNRLVHGVSTTDAGALWPLRGRPFGSRGHGHPRRFHISHSRRFRGRP